MRCHCTNCKIAVIGIELIHPSHLSNLNTLCHPIPIRKVLIILDWTKVTISATPSGIEIITAFLTDLGISSVEIIDADERAVFLAYNSNSWDYIDENLVAHDSKNAEASVVFYLGTAPESHDLLPKINKLLSSLKSSDESLGSLSLSYETVNDQTWLHEWKKHFHPFTIGRVLIVPEWEAGHHSGDIVFTIDPGSAFGTGQHATTMLCIEAIEKHLKPGDTVLDIGCGSGILSIISLLFGAKHVTACDIDPAAVEVTKKNALLNPIDISDLDVHIGDIITSAELQSKICKKRCDIIIANIVADVLIKLAPALRNFLSHGGIFIGSGIIDERLDEVVSVLSLNDFNIIETKTLDGWHCVAAHE